MKEAFIDVDKLNKMEAVGLSKKICKFAEESGELMQVICRYIGMKANQMSPEEMREEALGEIADVVQNSFCIASEFSISLKEIENYASIKKLFKQGVAKSKKISLENLGCEFYSNSGDLAFLSFSSIGYNEEDWQKEENKVDVSTKLPEVLASAFAIAAKLEIKFEEIEPKILLKNKKWLLRIEKRFKK